MSESKNAEQLDFAEREGLMIQILRVGALIVDWLPHESRGCSDGNGDGSQGLESNQPIHLCT